MKKPLRCLFGIHHRSRRVNDDGEPYTVCSRCGRDLYVPDNKEVYFGLGAV